MISGGSLIRLVLLIAFECYARQKAWYALLLLDPISHQLWEFFRTSVALGHELHRHSLVFAGRLENEGSVKVKLRCDSNLTIRIEG